MNLFKDSIEENVQFRRPQLYRNLTLRSRTVSDQPNDLQVPTTTQPYANRRPSNDLMLMTLKNQIKELNAKVNDMSCKIDDIVRILHRD